MFLDLTASFFDGTFVKMFFGGKMKPIEFSRLMAQIGFKNNESVTPAFRLTGEDLKAEVFKFDSSKKPGLYFVSVISDQGGSIVFLATRINGENGTFSFGREEVDWLARNNKFKKLEKIG